MNALYPPEGCKINTAENNEFLASLQNLERARSTGAIVEGIVTLCDSRLRLHVDLHCAEGIIDAEEALYSPSGEEQKDIAIITRVGKPVAARVLSIDFRNGRPFVRLSRRLAQQECYTHHLKALREGDLLYAKVTHLEPFGAFMDIGCGVSSLLSVDCISVSRIAHPKDRLTCGMLVPVAIKSIDRDSGRIYVTLRELLGTWEENVAAFEAGQTVTGIIRSVESYGVFIELAPNLAGLAEIKEDAARELKSKLGESAAVYIKSIVPNRMKIKLVLIDTCCASVSPPPLTFFIRPEDTSHLSHWRYSPACSKKTVETVFDMP